jgi:UDP-N-acetyl-D-mannosaminuronic acid transferase (WecB/TagA/CpsF family)
LLGVPFDNVTLEEALQRIVAMIESRRPHYVVTANVDFLVQARRDADLRRILMDSHMAICDGMPLVWASKLLGNPLPANSHRGRTEVPAVFSRSQRNRESTSGGQLASEIPGAGRCWPLFAAFPTVAGNEQRRNHPARA